jgi:hypothetical protein
MFKTGFHLQERQSRLVAVRLKKYSPCRDISGGKSRVGIWECRHSPQAVRHRGQSSIFMEILTVRSDIREYIPERRKKAQGVRAG